MATNDALVMVFERNAFYQRQYYLALAALWLSFIVMGVLGWLFYYVYMFQFRPLYFPADKLSKLIKEIPVDQPNMSDQDLMNWVMAAVQNTYSYNFVDYREQLQAAQKYFTDYGWSHYISALSLSNNLLALTNRSMVVQAQVIQQPTIINRGLLAGAYAWKMQMPVLIRYILPPYNLQNDATNNLNALTVTVVLQRQDVLKGYDGLGIIQMIAEFAQSQNTNQITNAPIGQ